MNLRTNWKSKLLVGALTMAAVTATAFTTPASAQIGIIIGRQPPPPMRYERRSPMPGEGYAWVDGYWGNNTTTIGMTIGRTIAGSFPV